MLLIFYRKHHISNSSQPRLHLYYKFISFYCLGFSLGQVWYLSCLRFYSSVPSPPHGNLSASSSQIFICSSRPIKLLSPFWLHPCGTELLWTFELKRKLVFPFLYGNLYRTSNCRCSYSSLVLPGEWKLLENKNFVLLISCQLLHLECKTLYIVGT